MSIVSAVLLGLSGCGGSTPSAEPVPAPVLPVVAPPPAPSPVVTPGPVELKAAIESISATDLVVDGHTVVIDATTVFDGFGDAAPAVGDNVVILGERRADGSVVATKITGSGAKAAPPPAPGHEED